MNKIYRLIWSRSREMWIAVSEKVAAGWFRRPLTVGALALSALLAAGNPAYAIDPNALPTGGQVVAGQANISQAGSAMTINQQTDKMIANWNTFNIGQNASVAFRQPGVSSVALNRILDQNPSQIFGALSANGQVFLLNPAGVYFGPTAQVDVGGLVASSLNLSNENFLAGKYYFENTGIAGAVSNQGQIRTVSGGYVAFLSPKISNEGKISTPDGTTALAAGNKVSLDFTGDKLVTFTIDQGAIDAQIANKGLIKADGGLVMLTARAANELTKAVVNNTGIIEAKNLENQNGRILLTGDQILQSGVVDASGSGQGQSNGGKIDLNAIGMVMNTGSIKATGNTGGDISFSGRAIVEAGSLDASGATVGGHIHLNATESMEQTAASRISADAAHGQGGIIRAESQGGAYLSGTYSASGLTGGEVSFTADSLILAGATVHADGINGGGLLRIGGGWQGKDADIANAKTTTLMNAALTANATANGNGGTVVVWSEDKTGFNGKIEATGGAQGGDGGRVEVSSHGVLGFGGTVDVAAPQGQTGSLLLDPKDIEIVAASSAFDVIPLTYSNPTQNDYHGSGGVVELKNNGTSTGTLVVSSPNDNTAATRAGAVRLYNMSTGSLLATLTGSVQNDYVGNRGVTALTNGNYVVKSPQWNNGAATYAGAVTWGNGSTGVSGVVSSANSLVGTTANDNVGYGGVTALSNGNYVVRSYQWNNGTATYAGAVTWGDGTKGVIGPVSSSNSLVGTTKNDQVGYGGITALANGNYVVNSYQWSNGTAAYAGAVTWGDGTKGVTGPVSSSNSLVGATKNDQVGMGGTDNYYPSYYYGYNNDYVYRNGVTALTNGNYVVNSCSWSNGTATYAGAVTWGDGTKGVTGPVSSSNSLVGTTKDDNLGNRGITTLTNGNYVIASSYWDNGTVVNAGAVTWGDGDTGITGAVSSSNSLVGTTKDDYIGYDGITALTNGNYVIASSYWDNGAVVNAGAVTWGDGTKGVTGPVSSSNSLVGTNTNDSVGALGAYNYYGYSRRTSITALNNGNYVVASPYWNNGAATRAGAVTWGSGATGISGAVSSTNSLVGTTKDDQVGYGGVTALTDNGNYVVSSYLWNNGTATYAGAVTWGSGATGITGAVSSTNSLVGTTKSDQVGTGGITALTNGNYVVSSYSWNNGTATYAGAVTWGSGATGITGAVSSTNSLVGTTKNDYVGKGGNSNYYYYSGSNENYRIAALSNGNYAVISPSWNNGTATYAGAVTWGDGSTGITGAVSSSNSLVGSSNYDQIGSSGVKSLTAGDYLVSSTYWNSYAGAVTLGDGDTDGVRLVGAVSSENSLVGSKAYEFLGQNPATALSDGSAVVYSPQTDNSAGRVNILRAVVPDGWDNPLTFNNNSGSKSTLTAASITTLLNAGTAVTLQANNDITLSTTLTANNTGGDGGALTLQAGRSILLNDSITTDNGSLALTANETRANGVVDAYRDAGAAIITMADGKTINAGTGAVSISLADGAGKTHADSGAITLQGVTAGSLSVANNGPRREATSAWERQT